MEYTKEEIKAAIRLKGLTQTEISEIVGCSATQISRFINQTQVLGSEKTNQMIVDLLQPELDQISKIRNQPTGR